MTLRNQHSMFLAVVASLVALLFGFALLTQTAQAQEDVETTGVAPVGAGGSAEVEFVGDLRKFETSPGSGVFVLDHTHYDDDPAGNPGDPRFHGAPNLDDDPMAHANKYVLIDYNGTRDVAAIQKTLRWPQPNPVGTGGVSRTVLHEVIDVASNPQQLVDGAACDPLMGAVNTLNTPADGLVKTGQMSAADMQDFINRCIQQEAGVHVNNWTISKHLPPGVYEQCVVLIHTNGQQSDAVCVDIVIVPVTGFAIDFDTVNFGNNLVFKQKSVASGDFNFADGTLPTVMGIGNVTPVLGVAYAPLVNDQGSDDPGDWKLITSHFDIQINRRNTAGQIVEFQAIDFIQSGQQPGVFGATVWLDGPVTAIGGRTPSAAICLLPNEPLKLDFSVTPQQPVFAGTYEGEVRLSISTSPNCPPTLYLGQNTTGDPNVFDNTLSQQQ